MLAASKFDWSQLWSSPLEFFGVVTGIICVFLITVSYSRTFYRNRTIEVSGGRKITYSKPYFTIDHILNWPIGLLTSAAYVYIFWNYKLYLNSMLQAFFYIPTGLIGWWWWLYGGERRTRVAITRATPKLWIGTVLISIGATLILWQVEANVVKSAAPFWDAAVVALSLVAQFVMTRKVVEHWWFWIAVDAVGVVLFWSQGLLLTSVLYFIYGCICVRGLFTWHKMYNTQQLAEIPDSPFVPMNTEIASELRKAQNSRNTYETS